MTDDDAPEREANETGPPDLLALVKDERRRAIGFEDVGGYTLVAEREKALNYSRGEMPDVPALPNRSKAVSTDVSDAIETILPDLMQILAEDEDVVAFLPQGAEDEEAAEQETDVVKHVMFQLNPGFQVLETAIRDGLQTKTALSKVWREDEDTEDRQAFEGKTGEELAAILAHRAADGFELEADPVQAEDGTWSCVAIKKGYKGCVKWAAWPPEDFAVSADTVGLADAPYCVARSRPRKAKLKADGYDPALVDQLAPTQRPADDVTAQARDTADETDQPWGGQGDQAIVEIFEHYIRVLGDDGKLEIWQVVTGNSEALELHRERVDSIPFVAGCPFPENHRFYGRSLADLLLEIQRIKTALTRMLLDSGYFALNQRMVVAENESTPNTLRDVMDNRPGLPIRAKTVTAVAPVSAGALSFDVFGALEHMSVAAEQRTGVVRNAQGLNPETLHDTARGAMALMSAAQRRTRMIAKRFAEQMLKPLFLLVHAQLQSAPGSMQLAVRLRNKWVSVDPTQWGTRNDLVVEVGLGAGRDQQMAMLQFLSAEMEKVVAAQGGMNGPIVVPKNVYALATRMTQVAGVKGAERYWSDPADAPPAQPQPNPEVIKAQGEAQAKQAQLQLQEQKQAQDAQQAQAQQQVEVARLQMEAEDKAHARLMAEQEFAAAQQNAEADRATDFALKLADINGRNGTAITVANIKADAEALRAHADIIIQASEHAHAREMRDSEPDDGGPA